MEPRMNVAEAAPALYAAVRALDGAVMKSGLEKRLLHLVKLRASQINGCAYCIDMHVKESLADGIPAQHLHMLAAWRESPLYSPRDRAALEWIESVTLISQTGIPDSAYAAVTTEFSPEEIAKLTIAIGTINVWNRIAVSSRMLHPVDRAAAA
ncbi:carboxymuconolactone decarboxylase family protein [Xanthobacter autotrophicus DSM 597]|uniref:carboxymuconolactone decarboxylase family protein n=1 Tax=Xanthobacter TaxID=279 RepID=UPI001AE1DC1E|nr:carboxymuconolactone decarboxylase family protein [Xanthobacter flavus]MBP2148291.1 AhpD family alkylhydroperoxidase [Xanthobacter flavus]